MNAMSLERRIVRAWVLSREYQKRMTANWRRGGSPEEFELLRIQTGIADNIRARATRGIRYLEGRELLKPGVRREDLKLEDKASDFYFKGETLASLDIRDSVLTHPEYWGNIKKTQRGQDAERARIEKKLKRPLTEGELLRFGFTPASHAA